MVRNQISTFAIQRLLEALATHGTFYVLGAGTSFGLVPTSAELREQIKRSNLDIGSFSVSPSPRTAMFERAIGVVRPEVDVDRGRDPFTSESLAEALLGMIQPAVLDTLVRVELSVPIAAVVPPQYEVFNAAARSSVLFSFNLDGLAEAYCGHRHFVFEPHGQVEREFFLSDLFKEIWADTAGLDLGMPNWTHKVLLHPEVDALIESPAFRRAAVLIDGAASFVFVGYSFAKFQSSHDDMASLHYFTEILRQSPKPVLVVDPAPYEVADMLCVGARRNIVTVLPAKWDILSAAILTAVSQSGYSRIHRQSTDAETILDLYESFAE